MRLLPRSEPGSALLLTISLLLAAFGSAPASAESWPHWRGPHLDSTSTETGLPSEWSATEGEEKNILWRHELPGFAASSPIVWEDRILLTSTEKGSKKLLVRAIDRQGKELWTAKPDEGSIEVFAQFARETNVAAPSPVTDGERVYALFGTGRLSALDMKGKVVWQADLAKRYGAPSLYFGLSGSPLLQDGRLYLQWLHADGQLVVALDAATGKEVWKQERKTDAEGECLHAYTSVMPFQPAGDGKPLLLVHGSDYTSAHRFDNGAEVWRYGTLNPKDNYNSFYRLVATPVSADGLLVVPTAKRGPVFGLRPDDGRGSFGEGDARMAWKLDKGTPDVPSPILSGGLVYLVGETGTLTVLDAGTGETLYGERVHQGPHRGSPVLADGKLYLSAVDGTVSVVKAGREYQLLAKNELDAGRLAASPAVSGGTLFLRTEKALFAIGSAASE